MPDVFPKANRDFNLICFFCMLTKAGIQETSGFSFKSTHVLAVSQSCWNELVWEGIFIFRSSNFFSPSLNAVKIILVFNGTEEANFLQGAVIDVIRKFGPRPLFTSGQEIRTLGDLNVLLQDSDASLSAIKVSDWTTTPVPDTTTMEILTTTLDWSALGGKEMQFLWI